MRFVLLSLAPILMMLATGGCSTTSNASTALDVASIPALSDAQAKRLVAAEFKSQRIAVSSRQTLEFIGSGTALDGFHYTVFVVNDTGTIPSHWEVQVHPDGSVGIAAAW